MDSESALTDREILLGLRAEDWKFLHGREKWLAKHWAQSLRVHPKTIVFSEKFPGFLAVKVARASSSVPTFLIATLKGILHVDEAQADDPEAFRAALPERVLQILDLPVERFPDSGWFTNDCVAHTKNSATIVADAGDGDRSDDSDDMVRVIFHHADSGDIGGDRADAPSDGGPAALGDTVTSLESIQAAVVGHIETLLGLLAAGKRPEQDAIDLLAEWYGLWDKVPEQVNTLVEARALADSESCQAMRLANDEALVASLTLLAFPGGNERAVATIATVQNDVSEWPLPLDEVSRAGLVALLAVLRDDWPADNHVQKVGEFFGNQVLMAAGKLTPAPPANGLVEPDPRPAPPVDPESAKPIASPEAYETTPAPIAESEQEPAAADEVGASTGVDCEADLAPAEPQPVAVDGAVVPSEPIEPELQELATPEPAEPGAATETTPDDLPDSFTGQIDPENAPAPAEAGVDSRGVGDYLPRYEDAAAHRDFGLAYWYAVAGGDEVRSQAARLLVLATSSEMTAGSPHPRAGAIAAQLGADLGVASPLVRETVAAALVPAALLLPPYSEAALSLNAATSRLGSECPAFIRIANTLTYERGSGLQSVEAPLLLAARDRTRTELDEFRDRAPSRTIRFHRATEVWRELIRKQGLLGSLVARALECPGDPKLREELAEIDDRAIDRIIRDTDQQLNPMQAKRQAIIAGAKQELASSIQRYVDLLRAFVAAQESIRAIDRGTSHSTDLIEELIRALSADTDGASGLGGVAMGVAGWLKDRLSPHGTPSAATERVVLARPLATAYEVERDPNGGFDQAAVTVELLNLAHTRTWEGAFAGYVARHDYVGLAGLLDVVRAVNPSVASGFEDRERRAKAESRETLLRAIERTRIGLSRALSVTSLSEAEAQDYQDKVERVARDTNPHFREALAVLARIDEELTARQQQRLDNAAARLAGLADVDEAARERVAGLIRARDLVSAEEFLAQLSNGAKSLPEEDAQDHTLKEFWAVAEDASASAPGSNWFADRLQAGLIGDRGLPHPSAPQRIRDGLSAWDRLNQQVRKQGWDRMLLDVLSAVGFQQVKLGQRFSPGRASTSNVFEAQYDGYALTPTFGSGARGQYAIFVCWERKTVDGLLQAVRAAQETQSRPTVVLYFQTLKPAERRLLAEQCRRKGLPNIVIDHAAMAYLCTREEARLDGLMHVCLPFTGSNPYTPFVLGDVPREMFYGRRDELRLVQDPNGPLFVYGGRQLGKSALLKTAMSEFSRIDDFHVSIYLDLKAEGIGEWHRADDLWRALLPHLEVSQVVGEKVSKHAGADVIARQIADWLAGDQRRHLLLLLDESDAFLDQDSRPRNAGKGQFKNVYMLKNLMNQSQRRFKPVFAGLHQVQRFHKESNGPMAHVGTEIQVGPLPPAEAYKLVVRPLEAIGYAFTSPDVVWRLLSHTNYQASLIQLFCQALVNDLKTRRLALAEPPTPIDGALVDRVYENKELRGQIAQRFDWTIQLDNRYRVIALVAAWLNLADAETVAPVPVLRALCSDFWPSGFEGVSPDEFRALLDEMVGLGVLVRSRADQYGIRSPNVIRLLGSKDEIERKLMESASLELPTVFDPARYRRRLADHTRSPLTEAQAARMLSNAAEPTLVVASSALGADRLTAALTEISSSGEGVQLFTTTPAGLTSTLTSVLRMRKPRHVLLDARGIDRHDLEPALTKLAKAARTQSTFTASVLLDPADRVRLDLPDTDVRELTVEPWTDVELRAVEPEADVSLSAEVRADLLDLTGGWPDVLEPVLAHGRRTDVAAMVNHARAEAQKVVDRGWDAFAVQIGVLRGGFEERVLMTLLDWGEPVGRNDLADLLPPWEPQRLTEALDSLTRSGVVHTVGGAPKQAGPMFRLNTLVARTIKQGQ